VVLFAVNQDYEYTNQYFKAHPIQAASVKVSLPKWFAPKQLVGVSGEKVEKLPYTLSKDGTASFTIDSISVGRIYVLSTSENAFQDIKGRMMDSLMTVQKVKDPVAVDGNLSKWDHTEPIVLDPRYASPKYYYAKDYKESGNFSIKTYIGWDSANLYLAAKVRDKVHQQKFTGSDIYREDCLQVAFDPEDNGGAAYTGSDSEYGFALTKQGPQVYCWRNADPKKAGVRADIPMVIKRSPPYTVYEAAIPLDELHIQPGNIFGFNFVVTNANKEPYYENANSLELSPGITGGKIPGYFRKFIPVYGE
jgi:hypothetical protein